MADKEKIRKALEIIAEESGLEEQTQNKLYATKQQIPEIETENELFKVRMDHEGVVQIESQLGPRITIRPVHTNYISKVLSPKGAVYEIKTNEKEGGQYFTQQGVCYVNAEGLVINSRRNVRIEEEN